MSHKSPITMGPFELHHPIGRGGMAVVWKGRHVRQDVPLALKVITAEKARSKHFHKAFRNEVRSMAGLDHPGIVMVFDHGEITAGAEAASRGQLVAGSPFLAMELATGGSLFRVRKSFTWRELRQTLRALLDALAHAHARGVIHRDLKPGNVLRATQRDMLPGIKLTDFGLAHALEQQSDENTTDEISGTPQYMAPEQFEGRWRDFGPWTDLYALGCMAYELACGHRPFDGETFWEIFYKHKVGPARLVTQMEVPAGFEDWVMRLMDRDPAKRFQRAADAVWALINLGNPGDFQDFGAEQDDGAGCQDIFGADTLPGLKEDEVPTCDLFSEMLFGVDAPSDEAGAAQEPSPPVQARVSEDQPPLPINWRRPEMRAASMRLMGVGLGLYGLRNVRIVARQHERSALWDSLRLAQLNRDTQCVVLGGGAGVGKSRLIEWICQRAHELGGATVFKASHGPVTGRTTGLGRMVASTLRCVGLDRQSAHHRCRETLRKQGIEDEYEWDALTKLMFPSSAKEDGEGVVRFSTPNQRYVLMRRLIERHSAGRPAILWLDDVQWGYDAIEFARYLLSVSVHSSQCPILVLVSAQDEALAERHLEAGLLKELSAKESAKTLRVEALEGQEHTDLVEQLLGLDGHLTTEVAQRTAGNPLFAIQLVGDWVQRGILDVSRTGFRLRTGEHAIIPDDIYALWGSRISRFLQDRPQSSRLVLELAAALGQRVEHDEWHIAAVLQQLLTSRELIEDLVTVGLAHVEEGDSWSYTHNMLRETLARSAMEAGRWKIHNAACAGMLRNKYTDIHRAVAHRLGDHLLEAGQAEEALEPLLDGAKLKVNNSSYHLAHRLLDRRVQALELLKIDQKDVRWGQGQLLEAQCLLEEGRVEESSSLAQEVCQASQENTWRGETPEAFRILGHCSRWQGNMKLARSHFKRALRLFELSRDRIGVGSCLRGLGAVSRQQQRPIEAEMWLHRALTVFESIDDDMGMANCLHGLGIVARTRGEEKLSLELYGRAEKIFDKIGYQHGVINCLNSVAEVSRHQGNMEMARAGYESTLQRADAIGSHAGMLARLNLALVFNEAGEFKESERLLREARTELCALGRTGLLAAVGVVLLPSLAHASDWRGWDKHFRDALGLLNETGMVENDVAVSAFIAGKLALERGKPRRARDAFNLARSQWINLKNEGRVAEVEGYLTNI